MLMSIFVAGSTIAAGPRSVWRCEDTNKSIPVITNAPVRTDTNTCERVHLKMSSFSKVKQFEEKLSPRQPLELKTIEEPQSEQTFSPIIKTWQKHFIQKENACALSTLINSEVSGICRVNVFRLNKTIRSDTLAIPLKVETVRWSAQIPGSCDGIKIALAY